MGSLTLTAALQLPVSLNGIQLGRPTDVLLDADAWQALGFVVHCGDESQRFLPFAASQASSEEIAIGSSLLLLEDVAFYATRGSSFRSLLGGEVVRNGRPAGVLRDAVLGPGGAIVELELERGGLRRRVPAAGSTVVPSRATAA
jgi:hypothetical protein